MLVQRLAQVGHARAEHAAGFQDAEGLPEQVIEGRGVLDVIEQMFAVDSGDALVGERERLAQVQAQVGCLVEVDVDLSGPVLAAASQMQLEVTVMRERTRASHRVPVVALDAELHA